MSFAADVNRHARARAAETGKSKVTIYAVWERMGMPPWEAFAKQLRRAHQRGEIEMARADLRRPTDVQAVIGDEDYNNVLDGAVVDPLGAEWNYLVAPRENPARPRDDEEDAAVDRYLQFHQMPPKKIARNALTMPARAHKLGKAVHVLYRSGKVDPETGKKPRSPQNYIHEHDAGVHLYDLRGACNEDVPDEIAECEALVLLGACLGLAYKDEGGRVQTLEAQGKKPELYCTPDGKCLVVVQDKREILYLVWGGGLGVEPRGIVG